MGLSSAELELADSQAESWGPGYQLNVMFLCMHNSCRSQMADGWMRKLRESDPRHAILAMLMKAVSSGVSANRRSLLPKMLPLEIWSP